jgi:hypothetical protein
VENDVFDRMKTYPYDVKDNDIITLIIGEKLGKKELGFAVWEKKLIKEYPVPKFSKKADKE